MYFLNHFLLHFHGAYDRFLISTSILYHAKIDLKISLLYIVRHPCNIYRIIESLRLEKASKIIKSNVQPNTTKPVKPCSKVPYLHIF